MKKWLPIIAFLVLSLAVFGCGGGGDEHAEHASTDDHAGHSHGDDADHGHDHPAPASDASKTGTVIETMDAGGYTYVNVDCGDEKIWAAAPKCAVEVGSEVTIDTRMPMSDFHSETLDRTFAVVYFTGGFGGAEPAGHGGAMGGAANEHPTAEPAGDAEVSGIDRAPDGLTVAEVWADRDALAGRAVTVRGKVVKYNSGILGKNWIHVRDGSGSAGTNDLTITTDGFAQVGDVVTVTGKVAVNKDFGAGYKYDVIVEDAKVVKK